MARLCEALDDLFGVRISQGTVNFITMNWRAKPLYTYRTVVNLIGATTTKTGLSVTCALDERRYEKGRKISNEQMDSINLHRHEFHGDWNYTIKPRERESKK